MARILPKTADELQKALRGRKIKIGVVCGGMKGCLISDQEEERRTGMESLKELLTAAGALGATGVIMVPARPSQTKLGHWEARELLVKILPELGEHAQKAGLHLLLEPLNRRECHFLRQVADGAAICRDVNHPGVRVMGDFWHMTWEETSDMAAFIAGGKYLRHVHMASRKTRRMPGEDAGDNYVDGFKGLKLIGYQDLDLLRMRRQRRAEQSPHRRRQTPARAVGIRLNHSRPRLNSPRCAHYHWRSAIGAAILLLSLPRDFGRLPA